MEFLASLIVAGLTVIYIYLVNLIVNIVPWFIAPVIHIITLALVIYFITKDSSK